MHLLTPTRAPARCGRGEAHAMSASDVAITDSIVQVRMYQESWP
jgi:hypothetical protein